MATGTVLLSPGSAVLPDGSTGNLAPALLRVQGTEANPKKHALVLAYDGAGAKEVAWWSWRMPADYASGGVVTIHWTANATTGSAHWVAALGAVTPGDIDTPEQHAAAAGSATNTATNTTEAGRLNETSITLANLDSAAAGDLICLILWRDSADAADTLTVDGQVWAVSLEYTST